MSSLYRGGRLRPPRVAKRQVAAVKVVWGAGVLISDDTDVRNSSDSHHMNESGREICS
jgi:hypothetical protein